MARASGDTAVNETAKDLPGVIAPPPLIFLAFVAVGLALDEEWPDTADDDRAVRVTPPNIAAAALVRVSSARWPARIRQKETTGDGSLPQPHGYRRL